MPWRTRNSTPPTGSAFHTARAPGTFSSRFRILSRIMFILPRCSWALVRRALVHDLDHLARAGQRDTVGPFQPHVEAGEDDLQLGAKAPLRFLREAGAAQPDQQISVAHHHMELVHFGELLEQV